VYRVSIFVRKFVKVTMKQVLRRSTICSQYYYIILCYVMLLLC